MKRTQAASSSTSPARGDRAFRCHGASGALTLAVLLAGAAGTACTGGAQPVARAGSETLDLPDETLQALGGALDRYEALRSKLAQDAPFDDLQPVAARLAADLAAARAAWPPATTGVLAELGDEIESAAAAAGMLADAGELLDSRRAFGEVSRHLLPAAAADARLRHGRHVFQCTMTETFALWMQADAETANPYLGAAMPTCGERVAWGEAANEAGGTS